MTLSNTSAGIVSCTGCGTSLPADRFNSGEVFPCGSCGVKLGVEVFPALFCSAGTVKSGEGVTAEGEASCFYHPHKKAVVLCTACGRFICSLCETELSGKCLCPSCIDTGRKNEELETLVTHRPLYDSMALSLAILPMLIFPFTIFTAPVAIYIAIRYWKRPGSILPRTRFRFVLAILIALAQIVGWAALLLRVAL